MNKIVVKLKPAAERQVKKGHLWIFEDSIVKLSANAKTGDLCVIFDNEKNKFLAFGLYDEESVIKIKLLQVHKSANFDDNFIINNIDKAYNLRKPYFNSSFNAYRLIYGESDFFPSLIIDIYNNSAVIKIYSLIWKDYLGLISEYIKNLLSLENVILRLSRNIEKQASANDLYNGKVLSGKLIDNVVVFKENEILFYADIVNGHKTGYFLDQRANRKRVGELSKARSVLDVFSYNGGFCLNAVRGGAKSVTCVDISEFAIQSIKENIALNKFTTNCNFICGDAFDALEKLIAEKRKFDIVVIDPPAFAKSEKEIEQAKRQYERLARLGARLVNRDGILVLASCSSRVSFNEFFEINKIALKSYDYKIIEETFHDFDHPAELDEMKYLKCGFYKFID